MKAKWLGGGLTHLLEHVLFNGTESRSSKQISDEIHGIGGYVNAYTSFDRTVFWVDCPAEAVRQSIDVLGDMLFRSLVEPEPLEKEMDIIRREFDMGLDDPDRLLSHLTFGTAFQVHPCRYPVIGIREVFDQLDARGCPPVLPAALRSEQSVSGGGGRCRNGSDSLRRRRTSWIRQTRSTGADHSAGRTTPVGASRDLARLCR